MCATCAEPIPRGAIAVELREDEVSATVCLRCAESSEDLDVRRAAQ